MRSSASPYVSVSERVHSVSSSPWPARGVPRRRTAPAVWSSGTYRPMDRATRTLSKAGEQFHPEPRNNRRIQARAAPRPCSCDNVISSPSSWGPQGVLPPVSTSTASGGTDSRKGSCAPQGYQHFPRYGGSPYRERDSAHDRGHRIVARGWLLRLGSCPGADSCPSAGDDRWGAMPSSTAERVLHRSRAATSGRHRDARCLRQKGAFDLEFSVAVGRLHCPRREAGDRPAIR